MVPIPTLAEVQAMINSGNVPSDPVLVNQCILILLNAILNATP